jgi:hypothetical protein
LNIAPTRHPEHHYSKPGTTSHVKKHVPADDWFSKPYVPSITAKKVDEQTEVSSIQEKPKKQIAALLGGSRRTNAD